jgi:hypothetical protein
VRDFIYDHTPLLQMMVGDSAPARILSQLAEIDRVEQRRTAAAMRREVGRPTASCPDVHSK